MNARTEILGRARRALADVTAADPETDVPVVRPAPRRDEPTEQTIDRFAEYVADYRAVVQRITAAGIPAAVAAALRQYGARRIVVPPGLPAEYVPDDVDVLHDGPDVPIAELDGTDGVVTTAAVGVAETGTIVLDHTGGQGRRAASLVPDLHVCVIRTDQIVPGLTEAVAVLDPFRPQTWISGPSATSDIELDRVEGVHGPRTLHVLLVSPD